MIQCQSCTRYCASPGDRTTVKSPCHQGDHEPSERTSNKVGRVKCCRCCPSSNRDPKERSTGGGGGGVVLVVVGWKKSLREKNIWIDPL